jgi:Domain of unknown function (DUF4272)
VSDFDPLAVKAESEARILAAGGRILDWLPHLDRGNPREAASICDRALTMHALLQLTFGAPREVIRQWIADNGLEASLSIRERALVAGDEELGEQEGTDLRWYIEALWALAWAGSLIADIPVGQSAGAGLARLMPDLQVGERAAGFRARFAPRPYVELFAMLDFYYRAHWYARNGLREGTSTAPFDLDTIMERRKALEWACDADIADWDETPADT